MSCLVPSSTALTPRWRFVCMPYTIARLKYSEVRVLLLLFFLSTVHKEVSLFLLRLHDLLYQLQRLP